LVSPLKSLRQIASTFIDGLVLGVFLGLLDLVMATHTEKVYWDMAADIFVPMAGLTLAAAALFVFVVEIGGRWTAARWKIEPGAWRFGAVAGIAAPIVLAVLLPGEEHVPNVPQLAFFLLQLPVIATGCGCLVWYGLRAVSVSPDRITRVTVILPPILALTFGAQIFAQFRSAERDLSLSVVLLAVLGVSILVIYRVARSPRGVEWVRGGVAAGAVGLAALPLVASLATTEARSTAHFGSVNKPVRRVILLTIDTLRRDALSTYGSVTRTPNLDALAADSVVFENAYSPASWTGPSFASMMTGVSVFVHEYQRFEDGYPVGLRSMGEYLRDAGYHTAALGYNYFLTEHISGGQLPRGFDYYDMQPREPSPLTLAVQTYRLLYPQRFIGLSTTNGITAAAQRWVVDNREREFAFWMHYYDPHEPYEPPAEFAPPSEAREEAGRNAGSGGEAKRIGLRAQLYEGEVRFVDANVGRFLQTLKDNGLYDETLIVMTSDHGEEMYEHHNAGHGQSLYQELLRVPFMVKLPKSLQGPAEAGRHVSQPVSMVSLLPTMLDLCGIRYDAKTFSSPTLAALLDHAPGVTAGGASATDPIFASGIYRMALRDAVIFDSYKYIYWREWPKEELYNLDIDPGEQINIAAEHPKLVEHGRRLLEGQRANAARLRQYVGYEGTVQPRQFADPELQRLKSLGYVQ
jgi:arylsulfatase A-like enzyme